jgi:hypothetical protein
MDEKTRADNRLRQQRYRELHRDEINEKRRERYEERKSKNRCPRCGGKVKKGYTLCTDCCEYQGSLNKKYAKKRKTTAGSKAVKKTGKTAAAKKAARPAAKKAAAKKTARPAAKKTAKKAVRPAKKAVKPAKKTVKRK